LFRLPAGPGTNTNAQIIGHGSIMKPPFATAAVALGLALAGLAAPESPAAPARGWLSWRGPRQNGVSLEKNLPDQLDAKNPLWVADFPGQSTPVIANGKLYLLGYLGEGPDLQEVLACFDADTGAKLWDQRYSDFLSDTIYLR